MLLQYIVILFIFILGIYFFYKIACIILSSKVSGDAIFYLFTLTMALTISSLISLSLIDKISRLEDANKIKCAECVKINDK